uniref:Uncharacterized protein n=1 Tax=Timema tahoe TaxID=61484 RepID=A0A7R9IIV2_9NEOP|nr:unnamed protein product [Timema tahoe]
MSLRMLLFTKCPLSYNIVKGASSLSPTVMLNPSVRTYRITSALEVLLDKKQLSSVQADVEKRDYLDFVSRQEVIDYLKQLTSSGDQLDKFSMNIFSRLSHLNPHCYQHHPLCPGVSLSHPLKRREPALLMKESHPLDLPQEMKQPIDEESGSRGTPARLTSTRSGHASKSEGESIADWAAIVQHLAETCSFGTNLESNIIDKFVMVQPSDLDMNVLFYITPRVSRRDSVT